jgi:hypothetical protein
LFNKFQHILLGLLLIYLFGMLIVVHLFNLNVLYLGSQ